MATFNLHSSAYWHNGASFGKDNDGTLLWANVDEGETRRFGKIMTLNPSFSTNFITHMVGTNPLKQAMQQDGATIPKGAAGGFGQGFN